MRPNYGCNEVWRVARVKQAFGSIRTCNSQERKNERMLLARYWKGKGNSGGPVAVLGFVHYMAWPIILTGRCAHTQQLHAKVDLPDDPNEPQSYSLSGWLHRLSLLAVTPDKSAS